MTEALTAFMVFVGIVAFAFWVMLTAWLLNEACEWLRREHEIEDEVREAERILARARELDVNVEQVLEIEWLDTLVN